MSLPNIIAFNPHKDALVVVDAQNDFMPGGALAVPAGDEIVPVVVSAIGKFDVVVTSQDWHPKNHVSFSDQPRYEDQSWPRHCVQYTPGAQLHHAIRTELNERPPKVLLRVFKGDIVEQYSAFGGYVFDWEAEAAGILSRDEAHLYSHNDRNLAKHLRHVGVTDLYVCGLATDYCVKATCLDAVKNGFRTFLISDGCRGVSEETCKVANAEMAAVGVLPVCSTLLKRQTC